MADFDALSPKQQKTITALLDAPTISAAAHQAGVGERTIYTWLDDATFVEAYRIARREAVQQTIARVQQTSSTALQVLIDLMHSTTTPAAVRLNAAKTLLELSVKVIETEDVERRLSELESRQRTKHAVGLLDRLSTNGRK